MNAPAARLASSNVDAAIALAQQGIAAFPVKPNDKVTDVPGWNRLDMTDPDEIRAFWSVFPEGSNLAIHCRDLLVLDIDEHKGGSDSLARLQAEHGELPDAPVQHTPSGGLHIFYHCPGGVPNSVGKLGPGLDVRSNDGYVLVAPSSIDGRSYTWDGSRGESPDLKRTPAPDWLIELCRANAPAPAATTAPAEIDTEQAIQRAREWLAQRAPAIEGQGGDAWTYATICRLRDFGVPAGRCAEALDEWNARCEPPWEPAELQAKIANVYRYGQNPPGSDSVEAWFDDISAQQPGSVVGEAAEAGAANDSDRHKDTDPAEIHGADIQILETWRRPYLIKHWLDQGSHAQLFGDYGQGKTFVALNVAAHIAAGVEWFGERVTQSGALYLLYEGTSGIRYRLAALKKQYPDWDWRSLPFVVLPINAPLVDSKATNQNDLPGRKQLQAAIQRFAGRYGKAPAFLVVDTYSRAIGGSASDEELAGKFASMVGALVRRYSMTVMQIHHPGHGDKSRGRGSYSIPAGVDSEIRIGNGVIAATKERDHGRSQVGYSLDVVPLGKDQDGDEISSCTVQECQLRGPLDLDETEAAVMRIIRQGADYQGQVERRVVLEALRDAGIVSGAGERTKAAKLYKRLKAKGYIEFNATTIVVLERGAAGLFEDFESAAGATG